MTRDEFKNLKVGDYIYDTENQDEWQVVSLCSDDTQFKFVCTRDGKSYKEGEREKWDTACAPCFALGRHPDNIQPEQPAELFVNVYKDSDGNLYTGQSVAKDKLAAYKGKGLEYYYTAKLVPVVIEQPYTPKHGEKCWIKDNAGCFFTCIAVEIKGQAFAYYESGTGSSKLYSPDQIKQFLPL